MSQISIDLNADLGEHSDSFVDSKIMPYLSSCNIACGGHSGNDETIEETIDLAVKHQVSIGAHPSFPDKKNFGRQIMSISDSELLSSIISQITLVKEIAEKKKQRLHHVKPHGALYNLAANNQHISKLIIDSIKKVDKTLILYGLAGSITKKVAKQQNIRFVAEGFADRQYTTDGFLQSRKIQGAVLDTLPKVLSQVEALVFKNQVFAGKWIPMDIQTMCLHSDTQSAVTLMKNIYSYLIEKKVEIRTI